MMNRPLTIAGAASENEPGEPLADRRLRAYIAVTAAASARKPSRLPTEIEAQDQERAW